jgi:hypothetical protein
VDAVAAAPPLEVVVGAPVVPTPVVLVSVAAVADAPPAEVPAVVAPAPTLAVGPPEAVLASLVEVAALVASPEPELPSGASAEDEQANPTSERPAVKAEPFNRFRYARRFMRN